MVEIVIEFVLKWWKELVIALVVVGAIWYVNNLQHTVETQRNTIAQLNVNNKLLQDSNKTLTDTVTANNKTIADLSKSAEATKRAFDKLSGQVDDQTAVLTKRLKDIMSRPVPVTCDDTISYMIDAAPTYKQ